VSELTDFELRWFSLISGVEKFRPHDQIADLLSIAKKESRKSKNKKFYKSVISRLNELKNVQRIPPC